MGVMLPSEYQQVEYLESTGTTYIDTLVLPADNLIYKCGFQFLYEPISVASATVFGAYTRVSSAFQRTQYNYCPNGVLGWGSSFARYNGAIDNKYHTIEVSRSDYLLDGTSIYTPTSHDFSRIADTLYLFALNAEGSVAPNFCINGLRCFSFEITQGDTSVLKFIPCYRKADNKPGMYDLISGTFFVNQGTGDFLVGGDVIDSISPWLIARRRMLMIPYWDYVWTYEDGLLSDNGWEKLITGTAAETLTNDGLQIASNKASSGQLQNYVELSNSNYNMQSGIMEVVFVPVSSDNIADGAQNTRICLSNGTNGITLFFYSGKWRFLDGTPKASRALWNFAGLNREYKVRIELINGIGNIWIGKTQIASNLNSSDGLYSAVTAIWSQNQGGNSLIKSVKFKRL